MDISRTIEADSTQINADDLTTTPRIVTVTGVSKGTADQPVNIEVAEFPGRAYRPCKSMRRVLVHAWGPDATKYVGRRMAIFNDPSVRWAGQDVGGVRIKALSDIPKRLTLAVTVTRGKRAPYVVDPLPDPPPSAPEQSFITADQLKKLHAMCTDVGLTNRDEALAWLANVLDREIASSKDIHADEVDRLFDELETAQGEPDA